MNEATASQAIEHLRAAALEAIAAARAFLVIIEEAVRDPAQAATPLHPGPHPTQPGGPGPSAPEPRVTRVPLS